MKNIIVSLLVLLSLSSFTGDKPAYRIFNNEGKKVKYKKMLETVKDADVIFFGELHNNPIVHWLQYELTKELYNEKGGEIILGAEMFETDNQLILNEYLKGNISIKSFEKEARLWPNYKTDYKPLVEFAKDSNLVFVATNIPRRYASLTYKKGFEGLDELSAEAKSFIAPLPIEYDPELKGYSDMMKQMEGMGHANPNLPKAQAIKDATMGYSIAEFTGNGKTFIHYNGAYHSNNYEGILWYLNRYKPNLKIVTITSVEQADVDTLSGDNTDLANFIIVVNENMTKTN
ncbi:MAG: iron-regulated protein [Marinilabiliales bacterium]|nr:MAG: iron-regulated protein [Marinilabiliales bacterium]